MIKLSNIKRYSSSDKLNSLFNDKNLFRLAFIHRSYLNEAREETSSNERLEFLGDSILSFVVSQYLFNKYPNFEEGILTNLRAQLVNTRSLAEIARELDFGKLLILSKGEEESKGRENQSILANSFEAFIGALFLDQGIKPVTNFLNDVLLDKAEGIVSKRSFKDPKSLLQEKVQSRKLNSPTYKVTEERGPAHNRTFTVGAYVGEKLLAEGVGHSKQEASENAAKNALDKFTLRKNQGNDRI